MGINIVFAHTNKIDIEKESIFKQSILKQSNSEAIFKQSMENNIKTIKDCEELSTNFWKCLHKHKHLKDVSVNCGEQYYYMLKCIDKIK